MPKRVDKKVFKGYSRYTLKLNLRLIFGQVVPNKAFKRAGVAVIPVRLLEYETAKIAKKSLIYKGVTSGYAKNFGVASKVESRNFFVLTLFK